MQSTSKHEMKSLCENQESLQNELLRVSEDAIQNTASAYRNISRQLEISEELGSPWVDTLESAQTETRMAMVDLVAVAAEDDTDKTKEILSGYGFDFLK